MGQPSSWAGGGLLRECGTLSFYGMGNNWEHRCQIGVGWGTGGLKCSCEEEGKRWGSSWRDQGKDFINWKRLEFREGETKGGGKAAGAESAEGTGTGRTHPHHVPGENKAGRGEGAGEVGGFVAKGKSVLS